MKLQRVTGMRASLGLFNPMSGTSTGYGSGTIAAMVDDSDADDRAARIPPLVTGPVTPEAEMRSPVCRASRTR